MHSGKVTGRASCQLSCYCRVVLFSNVLLTAVLKSQEAGWKPNPLALWFPFSEVRIERGLSSSQDGKPSWDTLTRGLGDPRIAFILFAAGSVFSPYFPEDSCNGFCGTWRVTGFKYNLAELVRWGG